MKDARSSAGIILIICSLAVCGHSQDSLTNGLVAYYPFNGDAMDASGHGHHGVVKYAIPAVDRLGRANGCYYFDRSWIFVPYDASLYPANQTISLWFKNTGPYFNTALMRAGNAHDDGWRGYALITVEYNQEFGFIDYSGWGNAAFARAPVGDWPRDTWAHLVVTRSGAGAVLYLDGQALASVTNAPTYEPARYSPLYIGSGEVLGQNGADTLPTDVPQSFWQGFIDEVRIYNRALSAAEVQELHHEHAPGPRVSLIKAVKPSLTNLSPGTTYQLQVSGDMTSWTNHGMSFVATNSAMLYPHYFDVEHWDRLFFRVQPSP